MEKLSIFLALAKVFSDNCELDKEREAVAAASVQTNQLNLEQELGKMEQAIANLKSKLETIKDEIRKAEDTATKWMIGTTVGMAVLGGAGAGVVVTPAIPAVTATTSAIIKAILMAFIAAAMAALQSCSALLVQKAKNEIETSAAQMGDVSLAGSKVSVKQGSLSQTLTTELEPLIRNTETNTEMFNKIVALYDSIKSAGR